MEQEKERKAEERNKILLDWSDEEDVNGGKKIKEDESGKTSDDSDEETEQVHRLNYPFFVLLIEEYSFPLGLLWWR